MGIFHEINGEMTAKELAKECGVTTRAINTRWNAIFRDVVFDSNAKLSPEQVAKLRDAGKRKSVCKAILEKPGGVTVARPLPVARPAKQEPSEPKQPPPPPPLPLSDRVKNWLIAGLLVAGVLSHAALVWYDCSELWGVPGQIGGAGMFAIVFAAVLLASDPDKFGTSGDALAFVFFVDAAAWFVHYEVFRTPVVSNIITGFLCAFICSASFFALYLYRQFKFQ